MRQLLTAGIVFLACGIAAGGVEVSAERAAALFDKLPKDDPWLATKDASSLAWGESHTLHAIMDLYEATADAKYLRDVALRGQRLLAHRDDARGVVDGSGQSRPAWSMAFKYVVADGTLKDAAGRSAVRLRSTPSSNNHLTQIELTPQGDRFTLRVTNAYFKRDENFTGLTLDRADARYIAKVLNHPAPGPAAHAGKVTDQPSELLRVEAVEQPGTPPAQTLELTPIPLAYNGYLGVIYHPLMRFAEVVHRDARLQPEFGAAAQQFVTAAEQSYADAQRLWRDGPNEGEGYYLTCEYRESFPYDNVGEPLNYLGRHAASQLVLHRLTGKNEYRDRAERMARLMKNRLRLVDGNAYVWNYWYEPVTTTGWKPPHSPSYNIPVMSPAPNVEDTSHGVLDIAMVMAARSANLVFDDADAKRFANTLLNNVILPDRTGVHQRVDGKGEAPDAYNRALGGWLELTPAHPEVYRAVREVYEKRGQEDFRWLCALLKWTPRPDAVPKK